MGPNLLRLAAEMLNHEQARCCSDYRLPSYITLADRKVLAELFNRANFARIPRAEWPKDEMETARSLKGVTADFIIIAALERGLLDMAETAGGAS